LSRTGTHTCTCTHARTHAHTHTHTLTLVQVLLNSYDAGRGIDRHNDGPLFHPVAAIISLGSSAVLRFHRTKNVDDDVDELASVVLTPGMCI
jgi:alkylated DNA repair dioxygenase AlkB